ncbi:MAG: hypothetical protein JWQ62_1492 [Lacunisphaera sp.]|nr:hypothetical protein [Lacunisphaera sp.]
MQESAQCFHNLEWPPADARLAGPVIWLRGWVVGKPGHEFTDVRVRHGGGTHLGVLGLPRVDLAAHFKSGRSWLPAEFILGVPVSDGAVTLRLEGMDGFGEWQDLQSIAIVVTPDGSPAPRVEGRIEASPEGSWTVRDAHHPFHGHLDQPGPHPELRGGRAPVFGWLLDESRPLAAVLATTDTLVFNHLAHSLTDDALALKVPQHAAARHARLCGQVDFPATLPTPACLRVYAVSPDGAVHLCFAQRLVPVPPVSPPPKPAAIYPALPPTLPAGLPSCRPRRLLFVVRSLLPNDATLRALDLARHLVASHRWAARLVTTEDGPLRQAFESAGVESLEIDPGPLFAAGDEPALQRALAALRRQIWWEHLDAVAVFDPVCGWAITLARQQNIPALFDCSADEPMAPDPTAIPAVQSLLRESWSSTTSLCFASATAARAQGDLLAGRPATTIPQWHTPGLIPAAPDSTARIIVAPLRTIDWLARHHPATLARWKFRQGPAGGIDDERLARLDDEFNVPALQRAADWSVIGASFCIGPLFARGPLRPVIDAASAGVPVVVPRRPLTAEIFAEARCPLVDESNPLAAAHALLAWEALPASFQREAAAMAPAFRELHDPARLIPQWESLLATVVAARG